MRMVQEMVQLLSRVLFLKSRQEYDQALREIHVGLRKLREEKIVMVDRQVVIVMDLDRLRRAAEGLPQPAEMLEPDERFASD